MNYMPDLGVPAARKRAIGRAGVAAMCLWGVLSAAYFAFRIPLWNPDHPILATALLAAEVFGVVSLLLHVFMTWTVLEREYAPPAPGAKADIFVTTWNEPVSLLRRTLLAARKVRHAEAVWLLDDGDRPEMRELARELRVRYLSRTARDHAKAGNLNNALKHSKAPFVAIFDCDHAPRPDFLEKTLGYFRDEKLGFVQTPQDFYNLDSFQHRPDKNNTGAWHEQMLFYRVIQPGKDRWNAAFFCGSCAVARRTALEEIGGIATGTITEDIHTSLRMQKAGWKSAYQSEVLAFGLSPFNWEQYETQRLRWGRGAMQVWRKEGVLIRGGAMSLGQRLCYLASIITYFEGWQRALLYFLPAVVLMTGAMPVTHVPAAFVALFLAWLGSSILVCEVFGRGYAKSLWMEEYNFFRYFTFMKATTALAFNLDFKFRVTPKTGDRSSSLWRALLPQAVLLATTVAGLVAGPILFVTRHHLPASAFWANAIWLVVVGVLAIRGLRFAADNWSQSRAIYRFPLPVPVGVDGQISRALRVAHDISADGLALRVPAAATVPDELNLTLWLPGGPLAVRADVRRRTRVDAGLQELGLSFRWEHPGQVDRLESFLYGNELQWSVNDWSLEAIGPRGRRKAPAGDWNVGALRFGDRELLATLRTEGQATRALIYERPPMAPAEVLDASGEVVARAGLDRVEEVETPGGPLFIVRLAPEAVRPAPNPPELQPLQMAAE